MPCLLHSCDQKSSLVPVDSVGQYVAMSASSVLFSKLGSKASLVQSQGYVFAPCTDGHMPCSVVCVMFAWQEKTSMHCVIAHWCTSMK